MVAIAHHICICIQICIESLNQLLLVARAPCAKTPKSHGRVSSLI